MAGMAGKFSRLLTSACSGMRSMAIGGHSQPQTHGWACELAVVQRLSVQTHAPSSRRHTMCPRWSCLPSTASTSQWAVNLPRATLGQNLLQASQSHAPLQQVRTRIRYSYATGEALTVKEVPDRFFRLNNGMWIRTRAGRYKRLWTKSPRRIHRLRQHVFINRTQCRLLDRMVNKEYRMPTFFVNDPYETYHKKTNLPLYQYKKPPFFPL